MGGIEQKVVGKQATRSAFGEALAELAEQHPNIVTVDADLMGSTKTGSFAKAHPERSFNVGIAEQGLVTTAAGLAISGKIPFACSFAAFLTGRAYDQVRTSVAISHIPVILAGSHAGILTGEDGATHQALEDLGLMRALPTMTVLHPADATETKAMVKYLVENPQPTYLRLGRSNIPVIFDEDTEFKIGKVRIMTEKDTDEVDLCVFATGPLVSSALTASQIVADEEKLKVRVVNVSSLQPLDTQGILEAMEGAKRVMTAEDHSIKNGLGSAVAEVMAEHGIGKKLTRHGMTTFGESGSSSDLYEKYRFDATGVAEKFVEISK